MMKKYSLLIALFLSYIINAQCGDYSQLLTAGLRKIDFFDENSGFAFGSGTMIITHDGGNNWEFVKLPPKKDGFGTGDLYIKSEILDENTAILIGFNSLYKTTDKGHTWKHLPLAFEGNEVYSDVDFVDAQTGYLVVFTNVWGEGSVGNHFFKTTDAGETWIEIEDTFIVNAGNNYNGRIKFFNELIGFGWADGYLYKTVDGGFTWELIETPPTINWQNSYVGSMKFTEDGTMVVQCNDRYFTSIDFGENWDFIESLSYPSIISTSRDFDVKNNTIYFAGIDVETANNTNAKSLIKYDIETGIVNTSLVSNLRGTATGVLFLTENTGYIVDEGFYISPYRRRILKTTDNGTTWSEIDSFHNFDYEAVTRLQQNNDTTYTLMAQETDFYLFTSKDKGVTWQQKVRSEHSSFLLRAQDDYISYISIKYDTPIPDGDILHESFDLGETWQQTDFINPYPPMSLSFYKQLDNNTLFGIENSFGGASISIDKGLNWTLIPQPETNLYAKFVAKSASEIYAWGINNNNYLKIYKTTDMGQTWQQIFNVLNTTGTALVEFGNEHAFVSKGNNTTCYLLNLNDYTSQTIPVTNPFGELDYLPFPDSLTMLTDSKWLIRYNGNMYISENLGVTWNKRECVVCGNNIVYNAGTAEIITYSGAGVERFDAYVPMAPALLGDTTVYENDNVPYYLAVDLYSEAEWVLMSGGNVLESGDPKDFITINWTEQGEHILKVRYINDCGASEYAELTITVLDEDLAINDPVKPNVMVSPNPFNGTIDVSLNNLEGERSSVKIVSVTGQVVYEEVKQEENFSVSGLDKLSKGIYFIIIERGTSRQIKKIIKK